MKLNALHRLNLTALAYRPKDAISLITYQLDEMQKHLAKIISHTSATSDKEWFDEITNKFLYDIHKKANKTSDKKVT